MDNNRILVITKSLFFDVDKLGASVILAKLLAQKFNTTVDILLPAPKAQAELSKVVAPQSVNFIERLDANYFTISIDRGNARVKEVKWEETSDKIKLIVFTEKGDMKQKFMVDPGSPVYDRAYTVGIKNEPDAEALLAQFKGLWKTAETFNLDIRNENTKYGQSNFVYPDCKSYAELILKALTELELEVTPEVATELLACIYWKTNSLRNKYTTSQTLTAVQALISKGGNIVDSTHKIFSQMQLVEVKARQEIYNSLTITSDKLAFAKVSRETAQQLSRITPLTPDKNPLYRLRDATASFIFIPIKTDQTLVVASSRNDQVNLRKLFGQFNFVGDDLQSEFTLDMEVTAAEAEVKRILNSKVFNRSESKETKQTSTPTPTPVVEKKSQTKITPSAQPVALSKPAPAVSQPTPVVNTPSDELVEAEIVSTPTPEVVAQPTQPQPEAIEDNKSVEKPQATSIANKEEPADPLAPAQEVITPVVLQDAPNLAPAGNGGFGGMGGMGDLGPLGGFGAGANANADPLPKAN